MNKRQANLMVNTLNGIIHSQNLYRRGRRVIDAHMIKVDKQWKVYVRDLWTETTVYEVEPGHIFSNGYGSEVVA